MAASNPVEVEMNSNQYRDDDVPLLRDDELPDYDEIYCTSQINPNTAESKKLVEYHKGGVCYALKTNGHYLTLLAGIVFNFIIYVGVGCAAVQQADDKLQEKLANPICEHLFMSHNHGIYFCFLFIITGWYLVASFRSNVVGYIRNKKMLTDIPQYISEVVNCQPDLVFTAKCSRDDNNSKEKKRVTTCTHSDTFIYDVCTDKSEAFPCEEVQNGVGLTKLHVPACFLLGDYETQKEFKYQFNTFKYNNRHAPYQDTDVLLEIAGHKEHQILYRKKEDLTWGLSFPFYIFLTLIGLNWVAKINFERQCDTVTWQVIKSFTARPRVVNIHHHHHHRQVPPQPHPHTSYAPNQPSYPPQPQTVYPPQSHPAYPPQPQTAHSPQQAYNQSQQTYNHY